MINYDSILSAFDGKPTLLQWLKLIKKALDESVLKDITLKQDGANVIFTFNFEDGTSISTPAVTLPKGDTGAKGDKGEQGVSVTGVNEVSNEVVGGQTLTTLRFDFSNGTNNEVVVHAENGKDAGGGKLYMHRLSLIATDGSSFGGIRFSTSPTKFSIEDMTDISSLINAEAYINSPDGSLKIYTLIEELADGVYTQEPDQMVLWYYPEYPGLDHTAKNFPKTSFNDTVTEL